MIVAIAGNAVEHVVGVVLAARRQSDLAIAVVVNSVAQIAAFLFPALVLISLTMHTSLTFSLRPIYIGALAVSAIVVWQITDDGEGHPYEGWALVATYLVLAIITLRRGLKGSFVRHKAIARWTLPIWLYVSITGVVVYLMLYQF